MEYIGDEGCFYAQNKFRGPAPCSAGVCDIPTDLGAEIAGNQATLNWTTVPNGTTYEYQYRAANTTDWDKQWTDQTTVTICDLAVNQRYEYRLRSFCENEEKSAYTAGLFTTGDTTTTCSVMNTTDAACSIETIEILKFRECHDRGTINPADDYFIADVLVAFSNPPGVGTLTLSGNAEETISVGQLQYLNIYRFSRIKLTERDGAIELTAAFSGNTDCQQTISYPIPANPCWSQSYGIGLVEHQEGLEESKGGKDNFLKIGPNPAQNELVINYDFPTHLSGNYDLSIYNIYGQAEITKVLDKASQQTQIDISTLKNGVHYLVLNRGGLRISKKIVKEDMK